MTIYLMGRLSSFAGIRTQYLPIHKKFFMAKNLFIFQRASFQGKRATHKMDNRYWQKVYSHWPQKRFFPVRQRYCCRADRLQTILDNVADTQKQSERQNDVFEQAADHLTNGSGNIAQKGDQADGCKCKKEDSHNDFSPFLFLL